jgi:hypothetical protein
MLDIKVLKQQFKDNPQPMGVYKISHRTTGKVFIGSGLNVHGIINSQRFQLENGAHRNAELQKDFARFGGEKFSFEVVDILERKDGRDDYAEDLKALEEIWLDKLQPYDEKGYNKRKTGPAPATDLTKTARSG